MSQVIRVIPQSISYAWLDHACDICQPYSLFFPTPFHHNRYRKKVKVMNENILRRWAWQILAGLVYLHGHEPPIVHRLADASRLLWPLIVN